VTKFNFIKSSQMKSIVCASVLALSLLGFVAPQMASAQTGGQTADGNFKFSAEEGITKQIEFRAVANRDGSASGRMTFSGPAVIPNQNVDGDDRTGFSGKLENLYIEAEFDGMLVEGNRAVMSGTVTGATVEEYIGQRVLLVVEDNGVGDDKTTDKVSWGLYKPAKQDWTPSDAELKEDYGSRLEWWATDAERKDDVGVPSKKSTVINCQSFPLSSYSFINVNYGDGDIRIQS
jgi:hypothetical protein